jgi:hypothetical protein
MAETAAFPELDDFDTLEKSLTKLMERLDFRAEDEKILRSLSLSFLILLTNSEAVETGDSRFESWIGFSTAWRSSNPFLQQEAPADGFIL